MDEMPRVKFAKSGDVHIAYMSMGQGPEEFLITPGAASHVELTWEARRSSSLLEMGRVTWFDKRGTGMSDRDARFTFEERIDDIRAVMDAAGIERAHLLGASEGGPMSILYAVTYPHRVQSLSLYGTFASWRRQADYPAGTAMTMAEYTRYLDRVEAAFSGDEEAVALMVEQFAPSMATDSDFREWFGRFIQKTASPGAARVIWEMLFDIDVRHLLGAVRVPVSLDHLVGDRVAPIEGARYMAKRISGARLLEFPGEDHVLPTPELLDASIEQIRENVRLAKSDNAPTNRRLATVVFSDLVSSTESAASVGDAAWRRVLDQHDRALRDTVLRHGGFVVKTTGDGILATFDGPSSAVRCGLDLHAAVAPLDLEMRVGMHAGEIETRGDDVGGIGVHIAARVMALAGAGETLASSTVKDLTIGSGFSYTDRGTHTLKGVPDEWHVYAARA